MFLYINSFFNYLSSLIYLPLFEFGGITFLLLFIVFEIGESYGKKHQKDIEAKDRTPITSIVTTTLGLLAFLLAFTYGLAGNYFETRKMLVIEDANIIQRTLLQADFIPEPERSKIKSLLKQYITFRQEVFTPDKREDNLKKSDDIQKELWSQVVPIALKDPNSVIMGLFVESISDLIGLHVKRLNFRLRIKIPTIIWVYIYIVAALSIGTLGYYFGLTNVHLTTIAFVLVLTFTVVLVLIADLDRPDEGFFVESEQPILDLNKLQYFENLPS